VIRARDTFNVHVHESSAYTSPAMPITVILGAQWGDEGKGRFTDALAGDAQIVARFNGGDNAGHSITIGNTVVKLHLVPSGIFREGALSVIGNGCVVNPLNLLKEMDEVRAAGVRVDADRLKISSAAHIILPGHRALDAARETTGGGFIGTTQRGIGYAYMDKANRIGIRAGEMHDAEAFAEKVHAHTSRVNETLAREFGKAPVDAAKVAAEYADAAKILAPHLANTMDLVNDALEAGKQVLAEGAQATLLDLDHGTYPFVTSSNATIGGVCTGLGVPPKHIARVMGVVKAFTSRVGAGPVPTEMFGDEAARLRGTGANPWDEFGSTTGRPRRIGWLDGVALRYVTRMNGIDQLGITKLDVLSGLPQLKIATAYELDGAITRAFPQDSAALARCKPVYQTLPGWSENVMGCRTFASLPANCRAYLRAIEDVSGAKIGMASVGPEREQLVLS
jgi:adenylosuccinate synthase